MASKLSPRALSQSINPAAVPEWRANWPVVLAAVAGMALTTLKINTTGVMIVPLEQAFGWSRAQISIGPAIVAFLGVGFSPLMGIAIDRFGPRRIGIIGGISLCVTVALFSTISANIWTWWGLWAVLALIAPFTSPTVWTAAVSSVFSSGRGLALAVALCGMGIGSSLFPVTLNYLMVTFGWRTAYWAIASLAAIIFLPPIIICLSSANDRRRIDKSPAVARPAAFKGSALRDLKSLRFSKLALAGLTMSVVTTAFSFNLVPILRSEGFSGGIAAGIAGVVGVSTILGRLLGGYLLDRINGSYVAGMSAMAAIISSILLVVFPGQTGAAICAVFILGMAVGAELDAVAYLTTRYFGLQNYGVLFGTLIGLMALGAGFGPVLANHVYDITKSYHIVLWAFVPASLLSALLFFSLGAYPAPPRAADA